MLRHFAVTVAGCLLASAHAGAETKVTPSWLKADSAAKAVEVPSRSNWLDVSSLPWIGTTAEKLESCYSLYVWNV